MTSYRERTVKEGRTKALNKPSSVPLFLEDLGLRKVLRNDTSAWSVTVAFIKLLTVVFYIIYYRMFLGNYFKYTTQMSVATPRSTGHLAIAGTVLKEPQSTLVTTRPSLCSMAATRLLSS